MKIVLGMLLCFMIGATCSFFQVPVPAPPALVGALLVVAMSGGYILTDRLLAHRPAITKPLCAGPTGNTKEESKDQGKTTRG